MSDWIEDCGARFTGWEPWVTDSSFNYNDGHELQHHWMNPKTGARMVLIADGVWWNPENARFRLWVHYPGDGDVELTRLLERNTLNDGRYQTDPELPGAQRYDRVEASCLAYIKELLDFTPAEPVAPSVPSVRPRTEPQTDKSCLVEGAHPTGTSASNMGKQSPSRKIFPIRLQEGMENAIHLRGVDAISLAWLVLSIGSTALAVWSNLSRHHWRGSGYWLMFLAWVISLVAFILICWFSGSKRTRPISFRQATREARVLGGLMLLILVDALLDMCHHTWLDKFTDMVEADSWFDAGGWVFTFGLVIGLGDALCDRPKPQHTEPDTLSPASAETGTHKH